MAVPKNKATEFCPMVISPRKSSDAFLNHLQSKVDCIETDFSANSKIFKKLILENASYCILNTEKYTTEEEFCFKQFKIGYNEDTAVYYQNLNPAFQTIYVIFETKTGYLTSNSQRLLLELFIEQGIDPKDITTNSILYQSYLTYIERYQELQSLSD